MIACARCPISPRLGPGSVKRRADAEAVGSDGQPLKKAFRSRTAHGVDQRHRAEARIDRVRRDLVQAGGLNGGKGRIVRRVDDMLVERCMNLGGRQVDRACTGPSRARILTAFRSSTLSTGTRETKASSPRRRRR